MLIFLLKKANKIFLNIDSKLKNNFNFITEKDDIKNIICIIFIIVIFLLLCEKIRNNYFLFDDNANGYLIAYKYNLESIIEKREFPLINFHQYMGISYFDKGQSGVLYLPVYIAAFLSKYLFKNILFTIDILIFMHLILAGVFMYLLLKKYKIDRTISFLCSLIWISFPFIILISKSWVFISYTAAFLPLNLFLLDSLIRKPSLKNAFFLAIIKGIFFFQGFVQYFHFLIIFEILYIIINLILNKLQGNIKIIYGYLVSLIIFFMIISPLLFPMLKAVNECWRTGDINTKEIIIANCMDLKIFLNSQIFNFKKCIFIKAGSEIYYVGIFLLFIPLFIIKNKYVDFNSFKNICIFGFLTIIFLILCTKYYSILYNIYSFNMFRWNIRLFIYFLFFLIIFIAFCSDFIMKNNNKFMKNLILSILLFSIVSNMSIAFAFNNSTLGQYKIKDLHQDYLKTFKSPSIGRILTCYLVDIPDDEKYKYLCLNYATFYNLNNFAGYEVLISKLQLYYGYGLLCESIFYNKLDNENIKYFNIAGVKYFITCNNINSLKEFENKKQFIKIYDQDNILVFENKEVNPLVYFINNSNKIEEIQYNFTTNNIHAHMRNKEPGQLIISITPIEGYYYFFDGVRSGKIKEGIFPVKINIPAGTKEVVIKYRSKEFEFGLFIFSILIILILIYFILTKFFKIDIASILNNS